MVTAGDEGLRGSAAGMIGGILGGLGMRLLGSLPRASNLDVLLAALAGSLWLTWITCAVSSGRERRSRPRAPAAARVDVDGRPLLGKLLQTVAERIRAG
jgi:hypothetical protein